MNRLVFLLLEVDTQETEAMYPYIFFPFVLLCALGLLYASQIVSLPLSLSWPRKQIAKFA